MQKKKRFIAMLLFPILELDYFLGTMKMTQNTKE